MGDDLLPMAGAGLSVPGYPPAGTRATIETPNDELGMLNRAGRYGWRGVAFTMGTWTLEFDGAQWTHATSYFGPPAGDGWQRIGRWYFWVYWAKPLYLPVMPGNPAPEDLASEKKLRRALARQGAAPGHSVVSGVLDGVRDFIEDAAHAVESAVLGTSTAPAPRQAPAPYPVPVPSVPVPAPDTPAPGAAAMVDPRLFGTSEAGQRLRENVTRLARLVPVYSGYKIEGAPVADRIERVVADLQDLLRRMHAQGNAHQRALAETHYAYLLNQLVLVVSPGYLKDVMDNPQLWGDADQRITRVSAALTALDTEILTNIRQVNASADLELQVALQTIAALGTPDELARLYGGDPAD